MFQPPHLPHSFPSSIRKGVKKLFRKLNQRFGFNLTTHYKLYHVKLLIATDYVDFTGDELKVWAVNSYEAVNSPEVRKRVIELCLQGYKVKVDVLQYVPKFKQYAY